jgi:hypothetical protein
MSRLNGPYLTYLAIVVIVAILGTGVFHLGLWVAGNMGWVP